MEGAPEGPPKALRPGIEGIMSLLWLCKMNPLIPIFYEKTKAAISALLDSTNICSIVMDIWSSKSIEVHRSPSKSMVGYMGISDSALTSSYIPFNCLLSIRQMPKSHTAAAIFAEYKHVMEERNLSKKLIFLIELLASQCVTINSFVQVIRVMTENARNMSAAFKLQLSSFVNESKVI